MHYCSKVLDLRDFLMLLKEVSYVYQGCIYLIKDAVKSEIVKQYITIKMLSILVHFKFIPVM